LSLLAFTTPKQFLGSVWPKIICAENGLAERVLFFYQKMEEKDLEETAQQCDQLAEFPVTSLNVVLKQVYAEHTNEAPISTPFLQVPAKHFSNSQNRRRTFLFCKVHQSLRRIHYTAKTKNEINKFCD
jgi:hypothetical protein